MVIRTAGSGSGSGKTSVCLSFRLFSLNQSSGQLSIRDGVPPGSYRLQVRVSDRTWPDVTSTAQVEVRELKQDALQNAASVRISSESRDVEHHDTLLIRPDGKTLYCRHVHPPVVAVVTVM